MKVTVHRLQSFTRDVEAGSEAGVVLDDDATLSDAARQALATAVGAVTTAFVRHAADAARGHLQIRYFTPRTASGVCMHATVAAGHLLHTLGHVDAGGQCCLRTMSDDYHLGVAADGRIEVRLPAARTGTTLGELGPLAAAIGLDAGDIGPGPVQVAGAGKLKLVVPVRTLERLLAMAVDEDALRALCVEQGADGVFLFCREAHSAAAGYHARHFNPLTLDAEDPICGIGSGSLGAYLLHHGELDGGDIVIEQGVSTGHPGLVYLNLDGQLTVGGYAVHRATETFELAAPPPG